MKTGRTLLALGAALLSLAVLVPAAADPQDEEVDTADWQTALLDDCIADDLRSSIGTNWQPISDNDRGGRSSIELEASGETLRGSGTLRRGGLFGGPGTAGILLPFDESSAEYDINQWDGVRLRIKRTGAPMLLRIVSGEIANGDHFAVDVPGSDEFVTYEFPFSRMGQVMSPQQPWQGDRVSGIELTCWSFPAAEFSFELDSIELYRAGRTTGR